MAIDQWLGAARLGGRAAASFARVATDAVGARFGRGLPDTKQAVATPEVMNDLFQNHAPRGQPPLPLVTSVKLSGVDFESSNCINFLVDLEFAEGGNHLPKTAYVKLPCAETRTRSFANTLGFWSLECLFCDRVAPHMPIRVPLVYAVAQQGTRFVLVMENLYEAVDARMFINRDMAAGTTPERAERVLRAFAEMHAHFWNWSKADREALLPEAFNTYTAPSQRGVTPMLNAAALHPARKAAPDLVSQELVDTCRLALGKWDAVLDGWYNGPLTLVHGDSHLGNCFEYPTDEGLRVGMIDFQAVHWSKGMRDVQYFLINSLDPEVLEENEETLIRGYCAELARHGATLSFEDAYDQFRAFSYQSLMVGIVPLGLAALTERDETVLALTRRAAIAVERLGFRDWVEGL